jgi:hypothetical protein
MGNSLIFIRKGLSAFSNKNTAYVTISAISTLLLHTG